MRYLLGYDIGSSSVKVSLLDIETGKCLASARSPEQEMEISTPHPDWAEQHPDTWWREVVTSTRQLKAGYAFDASLVAGIGIAYQMHGLVLVDKDGNVLRPAIIWCDSRAVSIGNKAFTELGEELCLDNFLNSPANFTASKLKWVKENEPAIFEKIHKIQLPGDYIAFKMTGQLQTTEPGLSEGIFWNFKRKTVASELLDYYQIPESVLPEITDTFSVQGRLTSKAATELGLHPGTPISYRAGDQPNNAFSLCVLNAGEIAATAGTSGVVYGINETLTPDPQSRINTFLHVNNSRETPRNGVLLCVNGTGILNSWLRKTVGELSYDQMNHLAGLAPIGAEGLAFLPFGNGAERILVNRLVDANLFGLNFNVHTQPHLLRSAQEGIVYALNYGIDIMRQTNVGVQKVRAGYANMFLSPVFREALANCSNVEIELYNTDGSQGAARGAGVGAGVYRQPADAFRGLEKIMTIEPTPALHEQYQQAYTHWQHALQQVLF
jgi:xylulokinase